MISSGFTTMASAAAAISNLSTPTSGLLPNNKGKIEVVTGTAKIIHPDDDISLVSFLFKMKQINCLNVFCLGGISCLFTEI